MPAGPPARRPPGKRAGPPALPARRPAQNPDPSPFGGQMPPRTERDLIRVTGRILSPTARRPPARWPTGPRAQSSCCMVPPSSIISLLRRCAHRGAQLSLAIRIEAVRDGFFMYTFACAPPRQTSNPLARRIRLRGRPPAPSDDGCRV